MRRVKALPAGSTPGRGKRRGRTAHRSGAGSLRGVLGAAFIAVLLVLSLSSASFASRPYQSQITDANGSLLNVTGLAVDSGDNVWLTDTGTSKVSKLNSSGVLQDQNDGTGSWAGSPFIQSIAYGKTAGLVYVLDSNFDDLWGLNQSDATYASVDLFGGAWDTGPHSGCCFLRGAVDNSGGANDGDIYVGTNTGTVTRVDGTGTAVNFSASQSYISANQITGTPAHAFGGIVSLAVDGSGDVYVADADNKEVDAYDSTGTFVRAFTGTFGAIDAVAIDPTNGDVLIGDTPNHVVHEFNSTGAFLGDNDGSGTPAGSFVPQALAVDSNGNLYVSDTAHQVVDVMGPQPPPHNLTVNCGGTGSGHVAPVDCTVTQAESDGSIVTLTATPAANSTFAGWSGPGAGSCPGTGTCQVTVTADTSVTATFTLKPAPTVVTGGASGITQHAATVAGTVNPNSSTVTNCHVDYGTSASYGSTAACSPSPGSGASAVGVSAALSGLAAGTTYHYRVVATNAGGTTNGADATFATLADTCATNAALCPPPPTCATDPSLCPKTTPPPTCATDPSLCPKPNPGVLSLSGATATVTGGKAAVKLSCKGGTACSGQLKLTAKVKVRKGHKTVTKTLTIGKVSVHVPAGGSATVKIALSSTARKLLAKKHSLKATLAGAGLKHTIVLKAKATKKKKKK